MKTLADFKRAAVVGSKWHSAFYAGGCREDRGVREICKAKKSYIAFRCPDGRESTFVFPKAKYLGFDEDTVTFYYIDRSPCIIYTLIRD